MMLSHKTVYQIFVLADHPMLSPFLSEISLPGIEVPIENALPKNSGDWGTEKPSKRIYEGALEQSAGSVGWRHFWHDFPLLVTAVKRNTIVWMLSSRVCCPVCRPVCVHMLL